MTPTRSIKRSNWRRGVGLTEMLFIGATLVLILQLVSQTAPIIRKIYENRTVDSLTQRHGEAALQRVARDLRFARRVVTAQATLIDLQMPAVDAKNQVVLPMSDGRVVRYYVGRTDGAADANGTILWRKEPASGDQKQKIGLVAPGGVSFLYFPEAADADSVTVTIKSSLAFTGEDIDKARAKGRYVSDFETSNEVLLRNKVQVN